MSLAGNETRYHLAMPVLPDSLSPCESLASKTMQCPVKSSLTLFEIWFEMFRRTDSNFFRIESMLVDSSKHHRKSNTQRTPSNGLSYFRGGLTKFMSLRGKGSVTKFLVRVGPKLCHFWQEVVRACCCLLCAIRKAAVII